MIDYEKCSEFVKFWTLNGALRGQSSHHDERMGWTAWDSGLTWETFSGILKLRKGLRGNWKR